MGKVPKGLVSVGSRIEFHLNDVAGGYACLDLGMELIIFTCSLHSPNSKETFLPEATPSSASQEKAQGREVTSIDDLPGQHIQVCTTYINIFITQSNN